MAKNWSLAFNRLAGAMEHAKPKGSPAKTDNDKEEELEDDLDKDKDLAPQLNHGDPDEEEDDEEDEELGAVLGKDNLKVHDDPMEKEVAAYNATREPGEKMSRPRMVLKLFKCLYIMELCNCHTLYQVSRGHYAFPQNMYNRTVVYQQLILQLVTMISIILSVKGVQQLNSISDDFEAFLVATLVITAFSTSLAYVLRGLHSYFKSQKSVVAQLAANHPSEHSLNES